MNLDFEPEKNKTYLLLFIRLSVRKLSNRQHIPQTVGLKWTKLVGQLEPSDLKAFFHPSRVRS